MSISSAVRRKYHTLVRITKKFLAQHTIIPVYGKRILNFDQGNQFIYEAVMAEKPVLVARIGSTELSLLQHYLAGRRAYPEDIKNNMLTYSGVFPPTDDILNRFAELFLESIKSVDCMGVWFNDQEDMVCKKYCPQATITRLEALEPYRYVRPWSRALAGKKVLVISSFAETIKKQYNEKWNYLFQDTNVLPQFNLTTMRAVQSIAGTKTSYGDWFEALEAMKNEMATKDFEVAIISAGAYGLPLGAFAKSLGKRVVHMGGAAQILFGIKGSRWDQWTAITKLYNEHWVRPSPEETPASFIKVEDGCYW